MHFNNKFFVNKKILVLAAHPDDEVLGCGATIKKLSKENDITLVCFTDGESARLNNKKDRRNYLDGVCDFMGIKEKHTASFPDNAMDSVPMIEICRFLESKINFNPDVIFTHSNDCLNIDHRIVSNVTHTVFRPQNLDGRSEFIFSYYVPSSTDYNPISNFRGNCYFNVEKTYKDKVKCLRKFYSEEMRDYPHSRSYQNVINLMKVWGSEVGIKYAEKFESIRSVIF